MRMKPATAEVAAATTQENEKDSLTGEISPTALLVANKYPGLPKKKLPAFLPTNSGPKTFTSCSISRDETKKTKRKISLSKMVA